MGKVTMADLTFSNLKFEFPKRRGPITDLIIPDKDIERGQVLDLKAITFVPKLYIRDPDPERIIQMANKLVYTNSITKPLFVDKNFIMFDGHTRVFADCLLRNTSFEDKVAFLKEVCGDIEIASGIEDALKDLDGSAYVKLNPEAKFVVNVYTCIDLHKKNADLYYMAFKVGVGSMTSETPEDISKIVNRMMTTFGFKNGMGQKKLSVKSQLAKISKISPKKASRALATVAAKEAAKVIANESAKGAAKEESKGKVNGAAAKGAVTSSTSSIPANTSNATTPAETPTMSLEEAKIISDIDHYKTRVNSLKAARASCLKATEVIREYKEKSIPLNRSKKASAEYLDYLDGEIEIGEDYLEGLRNDHKEHLYVQKLSERDKEVYRSFSDYTGESIASLLEYDTATTPDQIKRSTNLKDMMNKFLSFSSYGKERYDEHLEALKNAELESMEAEADDNGEEEIIPKPSLRKRKKTRTV